jgi:outer membrane biosynthesis protein TonB
MRRGLVYSLALHTLLLVLTLVGAWFSPVRPLPEETPVLVDLVDIAEVRNLPPAAAGSPEAKAEAKAAKTEPKPSPKAEPIPEAKPEPVPVPVPEAKSGPKPEARPQPKPEPKPEAKPDPKPEAKPDPKPEAKPDPKPEAKPDPKPQAKPDPKPEPKPTKETPPPEPKPLPPKEKQVTEAKPDPSSPVAAVKPAPKPEPVKDFASVLKTVQGMQQTRPPDQEKEVAKKPPAEPSTGTPLSFDEQVARALAGRTPPGYDSSQPISALEIDLVRRQIEACWNVPAGARDAADLVVHIRVDMNPDGTPRMASVVEEDRMRGDVFYRAAAESALRAVLNPRCHPFKLPPDKYERWRTMTLVFNPKEMLGT